MGAKIPWFPPFAHWRFSPHFTWGYLGGILLPMLAARLQAPFLVPIAVNFEVVFRFVFLVQGAAVFWFYLNRWRVRKPVGVILVALTMLVPPFPIVIGLLETWFDLRRLRSKK
jgi:uncharacterized protein YybS (DUF2232 family)